jgi:thioredoxin 1
MALELTDANYSEVVEGTDKLVLIDFWAEWCGPCKMIGPIVEELAEEYKDRAVITKLNVDENNDTSMKFGIRNIPTLIFLKNGEVVEKKVGGMSKPDLKAVIEAHL